MKASEIFARAVELVSGKAAPSRAAVESALAECQSRIAAAAAEVERLAAARPALLVTGSDADLERHAASVTSATLEHDRGVAIAAKLSERLAAIVAEEAAADRRDRRAAVEHQSARAAEALKTRFPKAVAEVRALLRSLAEAQVAIANFAAAYPDEPAIADPERVARAPTLEVERVVSEREVWRWMYVTGGPLPDTHYPSVREPSRRREFGTEAKRDILAEVEAGTFRGDPAGLFECYGGHQVRLVRMLRREVVRADRQPTPDLLASAIKLPGLRPGDVGWTPEYLRDPTTLLTRLDASASATSARPAPMVVEYVAIKPAADSAEAA